jgi:hypothetical protein
MQVSSEAMQLELSKVVFWRAQTVIKVHRFSTTRNVVFTLRSVSSR